MLKFTICTLFLLSLATLTVSESKKKVLKEDSLEACDNDSEENFIKRTEKEDVKKIKSPKKPIVEDLIDDAIEDDKDDNKETPSELPGIADILGSMFKDLNLNPDAANKEPKIPKESLFDRTENVTETPVLGDIIGSIFKDILTSPDSPIQKFITKIKDIIEKIVSFIKFFIDMTSMLDKVPK